MKPLISIVMPSYNAERTIELALKSIQMQTVGMESLEILVVDGGSTDQTVAIAKKYGAVVLDNAKKLPEYAKLIGMHAARGTYLVRQDADEVFTYPEQLEDRLAFLKKNPGIHSMTINQQLPGEHCGVSCRYLCAYGDPFSRFVYGIRDTTIHTFRANIASGDGEAAVLTVGDMSQCPIGDSGTTMLDLDYIRGAFPEQTDSLPFVCSLFSAVCARTKAYGVLRRDVIVHYSGASLRVYLTKLHFRIVNNLFHKEESGFSSRNQHSPSPRLQFRKYLYPLYALTLVCPLIESVYLCLKHRDASMLLHAFYVEYVLFDIVWCMVCKIFGRHMKNKTYGK